jgi:tryptophan synthase alpha chain
MNRIESRFKELREDGRKGFIPFVTAGDPDLATSLSIIEMLAEGGADIIELGVPFSDPMADGPTIQASSQRALAKDVALPNVLSLVGEFRSKFDTPIVLFGYLNPFLQYGIEQFRDDAASAGVDGVLITDVVDDEAAALSDTIAGRGIDLISLIAPTTSDVRLQAIASRARGFIYAVSRAGVTGARNELSSAARELVSRARKYTDLPIAVGFGISTRDQIVDVWSYADAAVVGSAIVNEIGHVAADGSAADRVRELVAALLPRVAKTPSGI